MLVFVVVLVSPEMGLIACGSGLLRFVTPAGGLRLFGHMLDLLAAGFFGLLDLLVVGFFGLLDLLALLC